MTVIALVNRKGGVGKTSTAIHLMEYLRRQGSDPVLIDGDAQRSSSRWADALGYPYQAIVEEDDLFDQVLTLKRQHDNVVIDAPGSLDAITLAILECADLALIPVKPSDLDVHATDETRKALKRVRRLRAGMPEAAVFISMAKDRTVLLREAQETLGQLEDVHLMKPVIFQRQCIADVPGQQATVFGLKDASAKSAAHDYESLFEESLRLCLVNV